MANVLHEKKRPIKIALIGGARTGKDTVARYLCQQYGGFKRLAFGDALKDYLFQVFPDLPTEPKPRKEMIMFGQACREIDPQVWIKQLDIMSSMYKCVGVNRFVITDLRQENEVEYCKEKGYLIIKVEATADLQRARALEGGELLDVNNPLDRFALEFEDYDYKIENNGDLISLYSQIDKIMKTEK